MLQIHTSHRLDQVESALRMAAERHGGSVLASSHVGHLLREDQGWKSGDAITFTLCFPDLYAPLLRVETRFAAFLPSRIAASEKGDGVLLETVSPKECCRLLHRPEIEPLAESLGETLRLVMEEAAHGHQISAGGEHQATEDLINMRAAVPQRIDCHGTKVEELAGTGVHDAQGG